MGTVLEGWGGDYENDLETGNGEGCITLQINYKPPYWIL